MIGARMAIVQPDGSVAISIDSYCATIINERLLEKNSCQLC